MSRPTATRAGARTRGVGPADAVGQVLVEFLGDPAPDVIGFKTAELLHGYACGAKPLIGVGSHHFRLFGIITFRV